MASKSDFTSEEWKTLVEAPQLAALAVAVSGASGLVGTLKEAFASSVALVEGTRSENELIRSLCARDEISAGHQALREALPQTRRIEDAKQALSEQATERARAAIEILRRKGEAADAEAYRGFVRQVGERVARAAKEGGMLGFGGKRVSEGEQAMLASLEGALAGGGAPA